MDKLASLGIDPWSMLLYLVNTGLLIAVLTYFFYRPLLKLIDDRRKQIKDSIDEAEKLKNEFEATLAKSEAAKEATEAELREELKKLQSYVEKKKAEMVAEMEAARSSMMEKAQKEIDEKKASLLKEAETDVKALMTRIILHIVENQVPEDVIQKSIESAWKSYQK